VALLFVRLYRSVVAARRSGPVAAQDLTVGLIHILLLKEQKEKRMRRKERRKKSTAQKRAPFSAVDILKVLNIECLLCV